MSNQLQIFNYQSKQVRTVTKDGESWFVAKDICDILELGNSRMALERLDNDEKGVSLIDTPGGTQSMQVVNEPGLYVLILGSRKKEAKAFKRWITHEVIPSIRKNGGYIANQENLTPEQIVANALIVAQNIIAEKDRLLEEQRPKVLFADAVSASKTSILIGELAKILRQNGIEIGQNRLFEWLRVNGYLISRKGTDYNMPTQYSMELGLFEVKETTITHSDGHISVSKTAKVTGKGQLYFVNKFIKSA